jgi:hypothetical protein
MGRRVGRETGSGTGSGEMHLAVGAVPGLRRLRQSMAWKASL